MKAQSLMQAIAQPLLSPSFLQPGRNCWAVTHCHRLGVLVDAQNYFSAFLSVLFQARRSLVMLAWDLDSRVVLQPDTAKPWGGLNLGEALRLALDRQPELEIYILCWDFAMIYSLERELFPQLRKAFRHPRIHFVIDGCHPFGGCHHQKVVIADERIAFTGGLDITSRRWDTRGHHPHDERRVGFDGKSYHPFHDVQMVVDGEAVRLLSDMARDRWVKATGEVPSWKGATRPIWPEGVKPDFTDTELAIARTYSDVGVTPNIHEVETLYLDSIREARRHVYIESQYFTSDRVADALCARLGDPNGPEFLLQVPRYNSGWLEQSTMGILRLRLIQRLRECDRYGKFRAVYPVARGLGETPISLHSKVMVVDDRILHIGSSNLSNRSMGLDTECDLVVTSDRDPGNAPRIARVRNSLLAEHLGLEDSEVEAMMRSRDSLFWVMDQAGMRGGRSRELLTLQSQMPGVVNFVTPDSTILDPQRAIEEDPYFSNFLPVDRQEFLVTKYKRLRVRALAGVVLALFFGLPDVRNGAEPEGILAALRLVVDANQPLFLTFAYFLLGALFVIPADLLVFGACMALTPFWAFFYSLIGFSAVAVLGYFAGWLRSQPVRDLRFHHTGFWAGFLLHVSLVSSYPSIAYRAGKLQTPIFRFLAGTLFGQSLRVGTIAFYAFFLEVFVAHPGALSFVALALSTIWVLALFRWSSQRFLPMNSWMAGRKKWMVLLSKKLRKPLPGAERLPAARSPDEAA